MIKTWITPQLIPHIASTSPRTSQQFPPNAEKLRTPRNYLHYFLKRKNIINKPIKKNCSIFCWHLCVLYIYIRLCSHTPKGKKQPIHHPYPLLGNIHHIYILTLYILTLYMYITINKPYSKKKLYIYTYMYI